MIQVVNYEKMERLRAPPLTNVPFNLNTLSIIILIVGLFICIKDILLLNNLVNDLVLETFARIYVDIMCHHFLKLWFRNLRFTLVQTFIIFMIFLHVFNSSLKSLYLPINPADN